MSSEGIRAPEQETSVRDDLVAAMASLRERDGGNDAAAASAAPAAPAEGETDQAAASAAGQPRDEAGRFAQQQKDEAAAAEAAELAAAASPAAPAAAKAPVSWSAEMQALFPSLDPKLQAEINRRELEMTRKITSVDDERTLGRKIKETVQPYQAIMAAEGATVDQAFGSFLNYNFIMRQGTPQQKVQALLNVARVFNVPLQQVLQSPQPNVGQNPAIESLEQRLNRFEQQEQARETQRKQQENAETESQIEAFSKDPAHPYFETVKAHMGALMTNGLAKDLKDAYDQACYAHPQIRSTLTAAQVAAEQKKLIGNASAARKAAGSVTGGPGAAKPAATAASSTGSVRDDIKAAIASLQSERV